VNLHLLRQLYFADTREGQRFRLGLLAFDVVVIVFFIATAMMEPRTWLIVVDYVIAALLILDYGIRFSLAAKKWRFPFEFYAIVDVVVIVSLLIVPLVENLAFLRALRMLRLLRSHHMLASLRRSHAWFRQREEVIHSAINLLVFIFVVTALVFVLEVERNESINNYLDALYFTVATLTTTGFGDITLSDTPGRVMAVLIMILGVALFLRLVQTIFRPAKVKYRCKRCGLNRHETDAVHCKHCGEQLDITTEGQWY